MRGATFVYRNRQGIVRHVRVQQCPDVETARRTLSWLLFDTEVAVMAL